MDILKRIFYYLIIIITLLGALAGILAFLAAYISPAVFPSLALCNLAMPGILFLNVLLTLFWSIYRKYRALIPGSILLLNSGYILSIFQITLFSPSVPSEVTRLKLASYNVKTFKTWSDGFPSQFDITNYLQKENADIVCFQEFYNNPILNADSLGILMGLPYHKINSLNYTQDLGSAIFSKYPFIRGGNLSIKSQSNSVMWADLLIQNQTIRILNCHLETTNFNQKRKNIHKYAHSDATTQIAIYENILETLKNNSIIRAQQADIIRHFIDTTSYPLIVCGDFNDTPASYTYHHIKGDLSDGFRKCGKGYGYTFRDLRNLFRIDFILYSSSFYGLQYKSPDLPWSDHNPIVMNLSLHKTPTSSATLKD